MNFNETGLEQQCVFRRLSWIYRNVACMEFFKEFKAKQWPWFYWTISLKRERKHLCIYIERQLLLHCRRWMVLDGAARQIIWTSWSSSSPVAWTLFSSRYSHTMYVSSKSSGDENNSCSTDEPRPRHQDDLQRRGTGASRPSFVCSAMAVPLRCSFLQQVKVH